jgi:hypothetical protein
MKQIEKQLLNKGFKNETLQKILNVKAGIVKLNTAVQQQGGKEGVNQRAIKESLIMNLNRCLTHC